MERQQFEGGVQASALLARFDQGQIEGGHPLAQALDGLGHGQPSSR
jgi:hypothetical protein